MGYGAVLRLNLLFGKCWHANIFTNSYIQVSNTFTMIALIAESTTSTQHQKKDVWEFDIWNEFCYLIWSYFKHYLQFTIVKDIFLYFFNLVIVCEDIEPRYGRTRTRGLFSTVRVVSFTTCMLSINLLKHVYIKFSG